MTSRKERLESLRSYVARKMDDLGIEESDTSPPSTGVVKDISNPSGYINAEDTWTGKVADGQNTAAKDEVGLLAAAFNDLLDAIDEEHRTATD